MVKSAHPGPPGAVALPGRAGGAERHLPPARTGWLSGELAGLDGQLLAQAGRRRAQDPRDLHLRDADAMADLALGHVLDEAEMHHEAVALGEHVAGLAQREHQLATVELDVVAAERVTQLDVLAV